MPAPKILIIIPYFYPHRGGAEQQALLLGARLQRQGLLAAVLTRHFPGLPRSELVSGVPVYRAIYTLPWGKLFGITYFLSCLWFLVKHRHAYTVIQCYILQGFHSLAAVAMKHFFKKKVIIRVSATGPLSDFLLLGRSTAGGFLLKCVRRADTIIVLCSRSRQEALAAEFSPQQIIHIPNGVDLTVFTPAPRPPASSRNILFVGRLDKMKGVDILLEAIAELKKRGYSPSCTIAGDGPDRDDLMHLAKKLNIANQVVFAGTCSDIVRHLHAAAVFVLPSRSEGMPNAVLEAMACGVPIIATSVGGIPDIIQNGRNGLLIAPDDIEALSAALASLFADTELAARIGSRARRDAEALYSLDRTTGAYLELYHDLFRHQE
ncbi:MAG: glycosyltransferase family 4 protein [Deltaproteobacteria bacterium]|nr:glycosyltransferase family 4 protein [Deltaproteobacteria bacterium]